MKRIARNPYIVQAVRLFTALLAMAAARAGAQPPRALFEPASGCYLGAYIDFDPLLHSTYRDQNRTPHNLPEAFEQSVGAQHAMYFFYLGYGRRLPLDWVRDLGKRGKLVHIALEPNNGLYRVKDDAYLHQLAADMRASGAPIFLRFASEMNGPWTRYGGSPRLYKQKFRLVRDTVKRYAPNVAMVWCPFATPQRTIPDYYPGDDATDWVGLNIYSVRHHDNQRDRNAEDESPAEMLDWFYKTYSPTKPVMICEFAATHCSAVDGEQRPDFAVEKIRSLYSALPERYPRVKCINYFDSNNMRFAPGTPYNDYSVTDHPQVLAAYREMISSPHFLTEPEKRIWSSAGIAILPPALLVEPRVSPVMASSRPRGISPLAGGLLGFAGTFLAGLLVLAVGSRGGREQISMSWRWVAARRGPFLLGGVAVATLCGIVGLGLGAPKKPVIVGGVPAMLDAILQNDTAQLKRMLAEGLRLKPAELGEALANAAGTGRLDSVRVLLGVGADPNLRLRDGSTALMAAAAPPAPGQERIVHLLIEAGARADAQDSRGATAMMLAAENGSIPALRVLIDHQASLDLKDKRGMSASDYAERARRRDVVAMLERATAGYETTSSRMELLRAVEKGDEPALRSLLEHGGDVETRSDEGDTLLIMAARRGTADLVRTLLLNGADPDATALDYWSHTALIAAADSGRMDAVDALIEQGVKLNTKAAQGYTALHRAVMQGHLDCVQSLLDAGADPDPRDDLRETPLMAACAMSETKIVKALLDKGADVDKRNRDRVTPLMYAVQNDQGAVVKLLLPHNPNFRLQNTFGDTALQIAIQSGHGSIEELIRQAGKE